jgi:putative peptidoglycan lipid II flippase
MIRSIATVGLGTLASRLTGFVRDALIAALLGAGAAADAFFVAFQFVNVVRRLIGEGALNAALVPALLHEDERPGGGAAFASDVLSTLTLVLVGLASLLALAMPVLVGIIAPGFGADTRFSLAVAGALMLPYLVFVAPVAVMMALLNAKGRFALAAFTPILFNALLIVAALIMLMLKSEPATAMLHLALVIGIAGLMQAGVLALNGSLGLRLVRPRVDERMRRFFCDALPGMIASTAPQLLMLIGAAFASSISGAIAWLYVANRLIDLPLGLVGVAMGTVLVPLVARDRDSAPRAEMRALELVLGLTLPAAMALAVLAAPITRVLFEHGAFTANDSAQGALALSLLAIGLPAQVLCKTWSASFFGRSDTVTPLVATLAGIAVTLIGAFVLRGRFGHAGIAIAISLGAWTMAAWLGMRLARIAPLADADTLRRLWRIALASVIMTATLIAGLRQFGTQPAFALAALQLAVLVTGGLAIYAALLRSLGVVTFDQLRAALRRES